jgi:hypothetical protein
VAIIKEEKEKTLMSSPIEKEDHTVELLTQWEMYLKLLEDWLDNPELEKYFQDAVMERVVECQHEEQLEEVGDVSAEELTGFELSEEMAQQKSSKEVAEYESEGKWQASARGDEDNMGDQDNPPLSQHEEMQQASLHERRIHPID